MMSISSAVNNVNLVRCQPRQSCPLSMTSEKPVAAGGVTPRNAAAGGGVGVFHKNSGTVPEFFPIPLKSMLGSSQYLSILLTGLVMALASRGRQSGTDLPALHRIRAWLCRFQTALPPACRSFVITKIADTMSAPHLAGGTMDASRPTKRPWSAFAC